MFRRVVSGLVVLGVLLHAAALARHNGTMLDAHLQRGALIVDLMAICHPSGNGTIDKASLPDVPVPTDAQHNCPVCSGLTLAVVLVPPDLTPHFVAFDTPRPRPAIVAARPLLPLAVLPPTRGPPSLA
jgi:hypothetical protein